MKHFIYLSVLIGLAVFSSCSDDDDKDANSDNTTAEMVRYAVADFVVNDSLLRCIDPSIVVTEGGSTVEYKSDKLNFVDFKLGNDVISKDIIGTISLYDSTTVVSGIGTTLKHIQLKHQVKSAGDVNVKFKVPVKNGLQVNDDNRELDILIFSSLTYSIDNQPDVQRFSGNQHTNYFGGVKLDSLSYFLNKYCSNITYSVSIP